MSYLFDRYMDKYGHYPRFTIDNGSQRLLVEFARGYIRIQTYPHGSEIYITANAARELFRRRHKIKSLLQLQDRSVDVPRRIHEYYLQEVAHSAALREAKRQRRLVEGKKARYQAAKRRARRQQK